MNFSQNLINWFLSNKRNLPWRSTQNPYFIWLSEIILQQTRVAQGLPYYNSFIENFPTIFDFANANETDILKQWQGLGYYSRARNMHFTAQEIAFKMNGLFPNTFEDLKKLKGIGDYTAAAIASIAFNEDVGVVDGNVYRVISRYFGIADDISNSRSKKVFFDLVNSILQKGNAAEFNQAIMEFGALQCVPKNPDCSVCVFNESCYALQYKKISELPVKSKKVKIKQRFFNYLWICFEDELVLEKRIETDIWKNLYQMPLIETQESIGCDELLNEINNDGRFFEAEKIYFIETVKHKLTHQSLEIKFWKMELKEKNVDFEWFKNTEKLPLPVVFANFFIKYGFV
jgi:A/G-specific adenine glycosylase